MSARFIEGDIQVSLGDLTCPLVKGRSVSLFGVTGLVWDGFSPANDLGTEVAVSISFPGLEAASIHTSATIFRELSRAGDFMGLRFKLKPAQSRELSELLRVHGADEKSYQRTLPRIPSLQWAGIMPLFATVGVVIQDQPAGFSCQLTNLSPNGVLLSSEHPAVNHLEVSREVDVSLEPRGNFQAMVTGTGVIRRFMDERDAESGNLVRHFGVEWVRMDEISRQTYHTLIRELVKALSSPRG